VNKRAFPHSAYNSPHNFSFCGHDRSSLSLGRTYYTLAKLLALLWRHAEGENAQHQYKLLSVVRRIEEC
jgi:hypothetical protein